MAGVMARPGRLLVRLSDTSLADAAAEIVHEAEFEVAAGAGPDIRFTLAVPYADHRDQTLAASARVLFHSGTELRLGDFTTADRRVWKPGQAGIRLRLVRVGAPGTR